jgi:hypothetical protein
MKYCLSALPIYIFLWILTFFFFFYLISGPVHLRNALPCIRKYVAKKKIVNVLFLTRETVKISIRNSIIFSIILFHQNGPYSKCSRGFLILNLSITNTWPQTVRLISVQLIYHIYYFFLSFTHSHFTFLSHNTISRTKKQLRDDFIKRVIVGKVSDSVYFSLET